MITILILWFVDDSRDAVADYDNDDATASIWQHPRRASYRAGYIASS